MTKLLVNFAIIFFLIWVMVEKIKMDVDRLLLVSKLKKGFRYILLKLDFFSTSNSKVVHLRPFLSSLSFTKFQKQNFVYFRHKHV